MYVNKTVLKKYDEVYKIITFNTIPACNDKNIFFTQAELDYCSQRPHCLGARFIIKQCVFDYLENELGNIKKNYQDIEILNNELKKPVLRLFNGISECVNRLNIKEILISISHSRKWISGMVLFCY